MAAIQEHLLSHRDSPEAAAHEVVFEEQASKPTSCTVGSPSLHPELTGTALGPARSGSAAS